MCGKHKAMHKAMHPHYCKFCEKKYCFYCKKKYNNCCQDKFDTLCCLAVLNNSVDAAGVFYSRHGVAFMNAGKAAVDEASRVPQSNISFNGVLAYEKIPPEVFRVIVSFL